MRILVGVVIKKRTGVNEGRELMASDNLNQSSETTKSMTLVASDIQYSQPDTAHSLPTTHDGAKKRLRETRVFEDRTASGCRSG